MTNDEVPSPEAVLAERISKVLSDAGLIRHEDLDHLRDALAAGNAKQDDWHFWIEQQLAARNPEVADGQAE